jgi:IS605 OrfB family transposase
MSQKRHTKVIKLEIVKPVNMTWNELGQILRDVRYRVYRLANMALSEMYLQFHGRRTSREYSKTKISALNRELRELLKEQSGKDKTAADCSRFSRDGALPANVTDALSQYKLRALTSKSKYSEIIRGKSSLPTFRNNMAIPFRCDKPNNRRLEKTADGDVELELVICRKPYPRVLLSTNSLSDGHKAILQNLLDNKNGDESGYRQRCMEIKEDERRRKWNLFVTYDFPAKEPPMLSKEIIVGVDLGVSCPLFVALNKGYALLGRRHFAALAARIRRLQGRTFALRRDIQRGGKCDISGDTARSGHGRKRKLLGIMKFEDKINNAYTTLNHQLSAAVIRFALNNGAGIIQMENLDGLKDVLSGTFLGERWRYEQLQRFIKYKADEAGIEVREVNPQYTSRRCSKCGHINMEFDRAYREKNRKLGKVARFECPKCKFSADPDYNAAKNIATLD